MHPSRSRRRPSADLRPGERGQAMVEFGLVVVIFFLIVSGIFDFGRALNGWVVLSNAAREGARQAAVGKCDSDVIAAARAFAKVPGVDPATVSVTVSPPAGGASPNCTRTFGDPVTVTVSGSLDIVTPLVRAATGLTTWNISSATTMAAEGDAL
jgi:Flp pilus assembly protein TadG